MKALHRLVGTALGAGLALAVAAPTAASAAPASPSPAQICKTGMSPYGGALLSGTPFEGYFYKMGGCASSVAHGALNDGGLHLSALTTRAGYIQTCQAIKSVGDWAGLADEASMFTGQTFTINTLPQCADVLQLVHSLPAPPE